MEELSRQYKSKEEELLYIKRIIEVLPECIV